MAAKRGRRYDILSFRVLAGEVGIAVFNPEFDCVAARKGVVVDLAYFHGRGAGISGEICRVSCWWF